MAVGFNKKTIKMRIISILLTIIFIIISCETKSQKVENLKNDTTVVINYDTPMKKFNIPSYEERIRKNPTFETYIDENGTEIHQYYMMDDSHFSQDYNRKFVVEYIQKETFTNRFVDFYVFNKDGILTKYERSFDDAETGKWKTYSEDGKILSEENKDINYHFSIQQVIDFSKKHKGNLSENGSLKRTFDEKLKKHIYEIQWIVDEPNKSYTKAFILDGSDGKIIKEFEKPVPWIGR